MYRLRRYVDIAGLGWALLRYKNGVLPMLKDKMSTAHAPCHVTSW